MVKGTRNTTRGASTIGCLFSILIFVTAVYYGIGVGRVYWSYYRLIDEMETSARFASTQEDAQILKHLAGVAEDLDLPSEAQRFVIRRSEHPAIVSIRTRYRAELELPFHRRLITLAPLVEVPQ